VKKLDHGQPRAVGQAIDIIFSTFKRFQTEHPSLDIRVTATYLPTVAVYQEAGYWCSDDLNEFLKYERLFAIHGGAVITDALYKRLYDQADIERFITSRNVVIGGEHHLVYIDSKHTGANKPPQIGFQQWLELRLKSSSLPFAQKNQDGDIELGQCTILDGARHPGGIAEVLPTSWDPEVEQNLEEAILPQHRAKWKSLVLGLRNNRVQGWSSSVFSYRADLSEDPFRFSYRPIEYVHGRAFHTLLESEPGAASLYREIALRVRRDKATLPNILSVGVSAIIGDEKESLLAIAQRNIERPGGYDGGMWSPTIGEQFSPFQHTRGSGMTEKGVYQVPRDDSVAGCAIRALKEELLGDAFDQKLELCIAAFAMENYLNNYFFCVLADLRPFSFSQLIDCWNLARDKTEHRVIAVLTHEEVEICIAHKDIPTVCWDRMVKQNRVYPIEQPRPELSFQNNAHLRLASYLWYSDVAKG